MGPHHQRQKNRILWNPNEAVSSKKYQVYKLQFDTSTLIILGSRLLKARAYKVRFISEPLYRFLYGIPFIVQQQQVAEYYSSSTGITSTRLGAKHQQRCCIYRPKKRSRTSPLSPDPWPGTLTTASGREDAVDVSHRSSGGVVGERRALAGQLVIIYSCMYTTAYTTAV